MRAVALLSVSHNFPTLEFGLLLLVARQALISCSLNLDLQEDFSWRGSFPHDFFASLNFDFLWIPDQRKDLLREALPGGRVRISLASEFGRLRLSPYLLFV